MNNDKYKLDSVGQPATSDASFDKDDLKSLDRRFQGYQARLDKMTRKKGAMAYHLDDKEAYRNLHKFSVFLLSETGQRFANSESSQEVAYLVVKLGHEQLARFINYMLLVFGPNAKACSKDNALRVAEKIDEIRKEQKLTASKAWTRLSDILRLQVFCKTPAEVLEVFR